MEHYSAKQTCRGTARDTTAVATCTSLPQCSKTWKHNNNTMSKRAAPSPLTNSKKLRNSTLSAKYRADQYTDFYASGDKLFCKCCQRTVDWTRKDTCDYHIASKSHVRNKEKQQIGCFPTSARHRRAMQHKAPCFFLSPLSLTYRKGNKYEDTDWSVVSLTDWLTAACLCPVNTDADVTLLERVLPSRLELYSVRTAVLRAGWKQPNSASSRRVAL